MSDGRRPVDLLDDDLLAACAAVAGCAMNRERQLSGVNSYARELGLNPVDVLTLVVADQKGTGATDSVELIGVDVVDAFDPVPAMPGLQLVRGPLTAWTPRRSFDLTTCVHGLHYVGDELAVLPRAAGWLTVAGRLVADLDLNIRPLDGRPRRPAPGLSARNRSYRPLTGIHSHPTAISEGLFDGELCRPKATCVGSGAPAGSLAGRGA